MIERATEGNRPSLSTDDGNIGTIQATTGDYVESCRMCCYFLSNRRSQLREAVNLSKNGLEVPKF